MLGTDLETQKKIDSGKEIFDKHYYSLISGHDFMRERGYHFGGWQMVAKSGLILEMILGYLTEMMKVMSIIRLQIDKNRFAQNAVPVQENTKPQEPWIFLTDACYELSIEAANAGFRLVFDDGLLRNYIYNFPETFEGVVQINHQHTGKNKYSVKKYAFLDALRKMGRSRKLNYDELNKFAKHVKEKNGHTAVDIGK